MRQPHRDLYALFRHQPEAETYFNSLPPYVREQLSARYRAVDSMERLVDYADKAKNRLFESPYPLEMLGSRAYLPPPGLF